MHIIVIIVISILFSICFHVHMRLPYIYDMHIIVIIVISILFSICFHVHVRLPYIYMIWYFHDPLFPIQIFVLYIISY